MAESRRPVLSGRYTFGSNTQTPSLFVLDIIWRQLLTLRKKYVHVSLVDSAHGDHHFALAPCRSEPSFSLSSSIVVVVVLGARSS